MFEGLTSKLQTVFNKLTGYGKLTEKNISDAMREVRLALLEADVNYKVVKNFIKTVKEKAVGQEVLRSIKPGQQKRIGNFGLCVISYLYRLYHCLLPAYC